MLTCCSPARPAPSPQGRIDYMRAVPAAADGADTVLRWGLLCTGRGPWEQQVPGQARRDLPGRCAKRPTMAQRVPGSAFRGQGLDGFPGAARPGSHQRRRMGDPWSAVVTETSLSAWAAVADGVPDVADGVVQFADGVVDLAGPAVFADQPQRGVEI